jgi:hypothetical protein
MQFILAKIMLFMVVGFGSFITGIICIGAFQNQNYISSVLLGVLCVLFALGGVAFLFSSEEDFYKGG